MQIGMVQRSAQKMQQKMRLSQRQIQSLKILSLSAEDLRAEIYRFAERNPALEVDEKKDELTDKIIGRKNDFDGFSDYERYSRTSSDEESDRFQAALESNADTRMPLDEHLERQINSMRLTEEERHFCVKIVENLDKNGFLSRSADEIFRGKGEEFKEKCLSLVQNLDPTGCAARDFRESLLIQARAKSADEKVPVLALFILDGHFDFLDPPQIPKIRKKILRFMEGQKALKFNEQGDFGFSEDDVSEDSVSEAFSFIRRLDPFPARDFSVSSAPLASPDVFVERDFSEDGEARFRVAVSDFSIPSLRISENYRNFSERLNSVSEEKMSERQKSEARFSGESLSSAKAFIDSVEFRKSTVQRVAEEIVRRQARFFERGEGNLVPLRQKDVADSLGIDSSTVSRMANGKFLSCEWGVFPLSHFFTTAVETSPDSSVQNSKEGVKFEISRILKEHEGDRKPLSDQKISDLLLSQGVKVARRTVAKYRAELNIDSSYVR